MDGYAAYNKLARSDRGDDGITLAGCWSHSRRKFYELHVAGSSEVATATLERMAKLWQVEKTVRGQSPDARVAARQQASAAVVADLFDLWQQTLRRISGKSNCRGDPLCCLAPCHLRTLPARRPHRARLQHRRARHQTADNYKKE
ncbi:hypothetical protein BJA5080_02720 [Bradyrhizobium diazoefficiens SEMIA 5080]|uniref:Transposase IS66 central domain-containing protein n=1 Tax=Bradyrhizobium diazoefficiens SEMIA 5080 TaxID=754504 RepID=A0A837CA87_9BRAD|nr:hypothetical protein BJA5080_02720 [Bradyrhizobium diazoefficiens SEMIA 5080]